jgi:hypothetical protein
MYQRILTALSAGTILLAFAMPSGSAQALKEPTTDSKNLNSSRSNVDRMGGGGGGKGAAGVTTVNSSKSNSSDRMGGGGGGTGKGAAIKTVRGSADRMGGGGGGKGAVQLNPQPEPPGRR